MSACGSDAGRDPPPAQRELLTQIVGEPRSLIAADAIDDTTLLRPIDFAVRSSMIAVLDRSGPTIRILDLEGRLLRVIGRRGDGPGELRAPGGIALSQGGEIAVADPPNRRISLFDTSGALIAEWPVAGRLGPLRFDTAGRMHADRQGSAGGDRVPGAPTIHVLASGQSVLAYGEYEASDDTFGERMLNEARLAPIADGGTWVLYPYRGLVQAYGHDGALVRTIRLPDPIGRPREGPFTEESAITAGAPPAIAVVRMPVADDVAVDASGRVFVVALQMPEGEGLFSELSVYSPAGELLGRQRLARRARRIAIEGDLLYALRESQSTVGIDVYPVLGRTGS